jgi:hypothetical protein
MKIFAFAFVSLVAALAISAQTRHTPKPAAAAANEEAPAPPPPGSPWPIETLTVEGNHLYNSEQILAVAGLRAGQVAGKAQFEAARDRLNATGMFDNVGYHFAPAPDNKGYDAAIEVTEVPQVYPVRFQDLPATDAELRAALKLKDPLFGDKIPATKAVLDRYVGWISQFLAAKNYREPIMGKPTSDATSDLIIVFRPAKSRSNIARVKFAQTGDLPAGMLETAIYGVAIGMPYEEAARDISLAPFADWTDPERILVNTHALYREFARDPTPPDAMALFAAMGRYHEERKAGAAR